MNKKCYSPLAAIFQRTPSLCLASMAVVAVFYVLLWTPSFAAEPAITQIATVGLNQKSDSADVPSSVLQSQPSESTTKAPANVQVSAARGNVELTPGAREIAELTGMLPVWNRLRIVQEKMSSDPTLASRSDGMTKLLYYRQRLMQAEQTINFEVDSTRVSVETELAKLDDIQAALTERRARSLMRNTVINFVSGGVTKLAGYSIALGSSETPTNLLEIFDGGIQCALSAMTIKEQHVERQIAQRDVTPLLTAISERTNTRSKDYPDSVWQFLNRVPPGNKDRKTRLEYLAQNWQDAGLMGSKRKHTGFGLTMHKELAAQLVEDRTAMLTDVKSVVSQMQNGLMDFSRALKQTYLDDPVID